MAYTLTFASGIEPYVNGVKATSGMKLHNGDVIVVSWSYYWLKVNGKDYGYDDTITITDSNINLTEGAYSSDFDYVSLTINFVDTSVVRLSVDVSTLAGWANLSAGEKNITIVAKAAGYKDSAPSAAVQVTKAASTKTLAAGTYQFVKNIQVPQKNISEQFACKGYYLTAHNTYGNLSSIDSIISAGPVFEMDFADENYNMYDSEIQQWYTESTDGNTYNATDTSKLRTIILESDQQVSADFYEWAITGGNLVKQPTGETWVLDEALTLSDSNGFTGIDFISNSTEYDYIGWYTDSETNNITMYYLRKSDNYQQKVYVRVRTPGSTGGWINGEAYRTLTFATAPSGDLLAWLQANGTKQS